MYDEILNMTDARHRFTDIANSVAYKGSRIVVQKNGHSILALVPIADAEMLEALEDRFDLEAAKKALAAGDFKSLEDFAGQLEL